MIKDIVVNLSVGPARAVATDCAASVASTFGAHVTGVAFNYDPIIPIGDMYGIPPDVIQSQRFENEKAAKAAAVKLDDEARRAAVSAQARVLGAPVTSAPNLFAQIARRFDLSVLGQPEPDKPALDRLIVEGGAVRLRPARARCPLHSTCWTEARPRHGVLGRQPRPLARLPTRCRSSCGPRPPRS